MRTVLPLPSLQFCSRDRSTWGHNRPHRSMSRCKRDPASPWCPIWDSSRRNWASSRSRPDLFETELYDRDCTVSAGSCTFCDRHRGHVLYCWLKLVMPRRTGPWGCHPPHGRRVVASSKCALCTIPTFRGICIPGASLLKRAVEIQEKKNNISKFEIQFINSNQFKKLSLRIKLLIYWIDTVNINQLAIHTLSMYRKSKKDHLLKGIKNSFQINLGQQVIN